MISCYYKQKIVCELKPHAKFKNPRTTPAGRKVMDREKSKKKKERENNRTHRQNIQL